MSLSTKNDVSPTWVGYADLQNMLFMVFMFLFIIIVAKVSDSQSANTQQAFAQELIKIIGTDRLERWDAEVLADGTIRFKKPENIFDTGSATIKPQFQNDLNEFIPLYLQVMKQPKFISKIKEIHIDGHTSAIWNTQTKPHEAFFKNLELSQQRTNHTLQFILNHPTVAPDYEWVKKHFVSNGYSSNRPMTVNPNDTANQRVEFKVILEDINDTSQKGTSKKKAKEYIINIEER